MRFCKQYFVFIFPGLLLAACFFSACEPNIIKPLAISGIQGNRVAVLCEGNFMWNNARLDIYHPDSNINWANAYEQVNKKPLGDVLQNGVLYANTLYLSINNSGKVLGINPKTLQQTKINAHLKSPRFILPVGRHLWITDLYSNTISVLDTASLSLAKELLVDAYTEQLVKWNRFVAVASYNGKVLLFDTNSFMLKHTIYTDTGSMFLAVDASNSLWVVSSAGGKSSMQKFAGSDFSLRGYFYVEKKSFGKIELSLDGRDLFFLYQNALWRMPVSAVSLAEASVFYRGPKLIYGFNLNPRDSCLYIADAKDYVSNGEVSVVNAKSGALMQRFATGVNPSFFVPLQP